MPYEHSPSNSSPLQSKTRAPLQAPAAPMSSAIQLTDTVGPLSQLTVVSNRITFPFLILTFSITFPQGCDNQVLVYPILAFDDYVSTSGVPLGTSLLSPGSPTEYLTGDNIIFHVPTGRIVLERGAYLKIHINNQDGANHTPGAIFTIQEYLIEET